MDMRIVIFVPNTGIWEEAARPDCDKRDFDTATESAQADAKLGGFALCITVPQQTLGVLIPDTGNSKQLSHINDHCRVSLSLSLDTYGKVLDSINLRKTRFLNSALYICLGDFLLNSELLTTKSRALELCEGRQPQQSTFKNRTTNDKMAIQVIQTRDINDDRYDSWWYDTVCCE